MTLSPPRTKVHAFSDDALGDHDAVGLAEEIRAGRISAGEAVDAAIARLETVQPELNGLACADFERARASAGRGRSGFFAGVPTLIKDNVDVAGLPTQNGCAAYTAHVAPADGDFAASFRKLGVIALGKSRLSEFGFSPSGEYLDEPPVRNPWGTGHSSGGSSAGAAVLVAAGAVPFAHAVDGGGSIRIPACCNGLVGLKPTRGRVPQDKALREMPVRIVADGAVTRSVRDTAAFLREIEKVHRNLSLPPVGDVRGPSGKRLRIALATRSVNGRSTDPEVVAAVEEAGRLLESLGHRVDVVEPPVPAALVDDFLAYWAVLAAAIQVNGKRMLDPSFDRRRTEPFTQGLARHALRTAHRLPVTLARMALSSRRSAAFYRDYDLSLTPVLGRTTPEIGWLDPHLPYEELLDRLLGYVSFTPLQNATGEPALSLPFATSSDGMPIGIHLGAPAGHEARLLALGFELEQARPFARITDG